MNSHDSTQSLATEKKPKKGPVARRCNSRHIENKEERKPYNIKILIESKMGEKSRRKGERNKGETMSDGDFRRILSCLEEHDYDIALENEDELVSHAEKDLQTSGVLCFLKLAVVYETSGNYDKTEHYLDRVMWINENMMVTISLEQAKCVFGTYLHIKKYLSGMGVYDKFLKGQLSIEEVNYATETIVYNCVYDDACTFRLQILEDHLTLVERSTNLEENHTFYDDLAMIYGDMCDNIKLHKCKEMQLTNARKMNDEEYEIKILVDLATNYQMMCEYDESLHLLKECRNRLEGMKGVMEGGAVHSNRSYHIPYCTIMEMEYLTLSTTAISIEKRSIAENGALLQKDAEEALMLHISSSMLVSDAYNEDIDVKRAVLIIDRNIANLYCEMGEFDLGIDRLNQSMELSLSLNQGMKFSLTHPGDPEIVQSGQMPDDIDDVMRHISLLLGRICLQKFYKKCDYDDGQENIIDGHEILRWFLDRIVEFPSVSKYHLCSSFLLSQRT